MKSFRKQIRAISPIFATLILIAIAIIAGVVVYMFTSGTLSTMTGSGTAGQEKVAVQGVDYTKGDTTVTVYAQNTAATGTVTANGMIIKNSQGAVIATSTPTSGALAAGSLVGLTSGTIDALPDGVYTVTITTVGGGSFVSPSFTVS